MIKDLRFKKDGYFYGSSNVLSNEGIEVILEDSKIN